MATIFVRDEDGWKNLTQSPSGPIGRDLYKRGLHLKQLAVRQVGKKTGTLASTITSEVSLTAKSQKVTVGSGNRIARLHHDGTIAHEIKPRKAKVLRFVQHGRIRYAHRVWHPGTKPNRYLTDNLLKVVMK